MAQSTSFIVSVTLEAGSYLRDGGFPRWPKELVTLKSWSKGWFTRAAFDVCGCGRRVQAKNRKIPISAVATQPSVAAACVKRSLGESALTCNLIYTFYSTLTNHNLFIYAAGMLQVCFWQTKQKPFAATEVSLINIGSFGKGPWWWFNGYPRLLP